MSKTLEELGYKKTGDNNLALFTKSTDKDGYVNIGFWFCKKRKEIEIGAHTISMEELKAIYKYCEDLGWI